MARASCSGRAIAPASSGRTDPASRRSSRCWRVVWSPTAERSSWCAGRGPATCRRSSQSCRPGLILDGVLASVPGRTQLEARIAAAQGGLETAGSEEEQVELGGELAELHEELAHHDERYGRHLE